MPPNDYAPPVETTIDRLLDRFRDASDSRLDYDVAHVCAEAFKYNGESWVMYHNKHWYVFDADSHGWTVSQQSHIVSRHISEIVSPLFAQRARLWKAEAAKLPEESVERIMIDKRVSTLFVISGKLKNNTSKASVIRELSSIVENDKIHELMNSHGHLLRFNNGVYDLKERVFRDGKPSDYCSYSTRIDYFPHMKYKEDVEDYLAKVFTEEGMRTFMVQVLSTVLDGTFRVERLYMLNGQGSNSKSRLMSLLQKCFGDYYCVLPIALLTQKRVASNSAQSEVVRTKGRRLAVLQEPSEGECINIGLMKELTGGDLIQARGLYEDAGEFRPQFKMFLTCNELPEVKSDDGGTWRRIRVIEFMSKFVERPRKTAKNEFALDPELEDKLERWKETFMTYLIQTYQSLPTDNKGKRIIEEPPSVIKATQKYRNVNDMVGSYIEDRICFLGEEDTPVRTTIASLYMDYKSWCSQNMAKPMKMARHEFEKQFVAKMKEQYGADLSQSVILSRTILKQEGGDDEEEEMPETLDQHFYRWFRASFTKDVTATTAFLTDKIRSVYIDRYLPPSIRNSMMPETIQDRVSKCLKLQVEQIGAIKRTYGKKKRAAVGQLACNEELRDLLMK